MTYLIILAIAAATLAAINALFVLYVFSMNVQRVFIEGRMTAWHWFCAGGWVVVAVLLDVLLNFTLLAALTADFPKPGELTFSRRLERLVRGSDWRATMAKGIAFVLDPFDPKGKHIS